MKRLYVLLAGALLLCAGAAQADEILISIEDLLARQAAQPELVLIDAEIPDRFARAHIPGAVNLPHMELEDAEENAETGRPIFPQLAANRLGEAGIAVDTPVVVYDGGDGRAASAVWYILRYIGHQDVRILDGGFRKWLAQGHPVTQQARAVEQMRYILPDRERKEWELTTDRLRELLDRGEAVLVDTRSIAEFAGKETGGARRAGHIPGAVSLPWTRLAGEPETFADDEILRRALERAGLSPDQTIVTYCNPGLGRSTFLLAALTRLGFENVIVYPGSWNEWAADPRLPVAR
ncbi:hypothetical protein B1C78_03420 [Thioalkalivibrio denitrificans]|uniref:Sulfurtransferase n=1 Tax=Thioalkalivibrio denitrificans TaxID=108003 RepID=A0A1V3NS61_9GAMM|nr:sulfurtransferase [Thioalkalivibrio denitrificans]OOG27708.1 hypothetical protein B1C78_03420 [Thioalkalivibrio denitrificans]